MHYCHYFQENKGQEVEHISPKAKSSVTETSTLLITSGTTIYLST